MFVRRFNRLSRKPKRGVPMRRIRERKARRVGEPRPSSRLLIQEQGRFGRRESEIGRTLLAGVARICRLRSAAMDDVVGPSESRAPASAGHDVRRRDAEWRKDARWFAQEKGLLNSVHGDFPRPRVFSHTCVAKPNSASSTAKRIRTRTLHRDTAAAARLSSTRHR